MNLNLNKPEESQKLLFQKLKVILVARLKKEAVCKPNDPNKIITTVNLLYVNKTRHRYKKTLMLRIKQHLFKFKMST